MGTPLRKTRKLTVAGSLMLIAVALTFTWLAIVFDLIPGLQHLRADAIAWVLSPLPLFGLALGFTGHETVANVLAILYLLGIIMAVVGSIFALKGRTWGLAIAGSVGTLLCAPLPGIVAGILTVMSRDEQLKKKIYEVRVKSQPSLQSLL